MASHNPCTLGVGCDETSICYAEANGYPSQRGRKVDATDWTSEPEPMTNTQIHNAIEAVLTAKGATPEWLRYAMPDIHVEVTRFGNTEFVRGYQAKEQGLGCGAYDPPRVGSDELHEESRPDIEDPALEANEGRCDED